MKIEWLGHATFIITSNNGIKILTDPYKSEGLQGSIKYGPIKENVDIVTVSHAHSDHCHIPIGLKDATIVRNNIDDTINGIKIKTIDSFHDTASGKERGCNSIFVFNVDGIKIAHFGDLGHILDDAHIRELGQIDVALIPVGGVFTIDAKVASEIIEKIKPKIVIPMHFKTPKLGFDIDKVDTFLINKKDVEQPGVSEIEINPSMLSSTATKIIVLKYSH